MVESSVMDNWMRVKIMHSIAKSFYEETCDTEYRKFRNQPNGSLMFNLEYDEWMDKESCIVGVLMAWSVITIDSLANHVLAETIGDKDQAIRAIECPGNVSKEIKKSSKSDLARKLIVLAGDSTSEEIAGLADKLADIRNGIVHDKPFDYICTEDDIEIEYYRTRGELETTRFRFEYLDSFYKDCKKICSYIEQFHCVISPMGDEVDFDILERSQPAKSSEDRKSQPSE